MIVTVGIDIGQTHDPTALVIDEMQWRAPAPDMPSIHALVDHHVIKHLERLEIGTKYPKVVEHLKSRLDTLQERVYAANLVNFAGELIPDDHAYITAYVDATGVGLPVVDALREAGCRIIGVYFTSGDKRLEQRDETTNEIRVVLGKAYMVSRMQVIMQHHRLHLPDVPEARALAKELLNYQIKVDNNANDTYGAFKVGTHDDLATALGLAMNKRPQLGGTVAGSQGARAAMWGQAAAQSGIDPVAGGSVNYDFTGGNISGLPRDPMIGRGY